MCRDYNLNKTNKKAQAKTDAEKDLLKRMDNTLFEQDSVVYESVLSR